MASETKGAVHKLSKKAINAKHCPCNNHILNNSFSKSSKVTSCRNASGTMRKVVDNPLKIMYKILIMRYYIFLVFTLLSNFKYLKCSKY